MFTTLTKIFFTFKKLNSKIASLINIKSQKLKNI